MTNDLESKPATVKQHYRLRQQIEEAIRLLKQEFGWGGSSVRKAKAQVAHLHLGVMAMCLAQHVAYQHKQSIYAFKRDLFCQSIPEQLPFWEDFPAAA